MKSLALFISIVFHPLLMVTYGCLLLFFGIKNTVFDYLTPADTKWRIPIVVCMFSFFFPLVNIFILYRLKRIPAITLSERKDRTFPYIMTSLFYFGLFYLLFDLNIWNSIKYFIGASGLAILLTALFNLKFKISAHMVGIGGLLGFLISVSYLTQFNMTPFYIGIIIVAGIIGVARLALEEHRPYQVYSGFLLGLFVQMAVFFTFHKIIFA